jgi:hypothetical protein
VTWKKGLTILLAVAFIAAVGYVVWYVQPGTLGGFLLTETPDSLTATLTEPYADDDSLVAVTTIDAPKGSDEADELLDVLENLSCRRSLYGLMSHRVIAYRLGQETLSLSAAYGDQMCNMLLYSGEELLETYGDRQSDQGTYLVDQSTEDALAEIVKKYGETEIKAPG